MHKERNSKNTELARCKIMARLLNDFSGYLQLDCSFLFAGTVSILCWVFFLQTVLESNFETNVFVTKHASLICKLK